MRVKSQQCFSSGIGVVVNLRRSAGDDRYFCAWAHTDLLVPSFRDQTLLAVEQVESEKERFLSGKKKLLFLHPECLGGSGLFGSAQVLCSCLPEFHPGTHPSSLLPQTRRNVFLILQKVPHQRHRCSLLILRERDRQLSHEGKRNPSFSQRFFFFFYPQPSGHYRTGSNSIYANQLYLY